MCEGQIKSIKIPFFGKGMGAQVFVADPLYVSTSVCFPDTIKNGKMPPKRKKRLTSVLNWFHMRNTDQKSSLQYLAAQRTQSPSFSAEVHI
jgi:hypothetical protein